MILHEDDQEGHDFCDFCAKLSSWFHYRPENGKAGLFDEARSAHDRWFCENVLASLKDSSGHQELAAKTRELEQVQRQLSGECFEDRRLQTQFNTAANALKAMWQNNIILGQETRRLRWSRDEEDMERRRLQEEFEGREKQQCALFACVHARLGKVLEERGAFRRDLKIAQRELGDTWRELEDVRRELENARREQGLKTRTPPPRLPIEDVSTSSAVGLSSSTQPCVN
jgi:hypothetical protein